MTKTIITTLALSLLMGGCHYNVDDLTYREIASQHVEECEASGEEECPSVREARAEVREQANARAEKLRAMRQAQREEQERQRQIARNAYNNSCRGQYSRIIRGHSTYGAIRRYVSQCR